MVLTLESYIPGTPESQAPWSSWFPHPQDTALALTSRQIKDTAIYGCKLKELKYFLD